MRKVLTFLGASLFIGWIAPAKAQVAPDMFRDVPQEHWAYQAVESLRSKGILIGYPDGYFRGKRTLTRYEFAVALKRALDQVEGTKGETGPAGPPGPQGEVGPAGPQGEVGPAGVTPEELAEFKRLATEFRQELANLGTNVNALSAKLDRLSKDVADLKSDIAKMPKISGGAFMAVRSDRAAHPYVDRDGIAIGSPDIVNTATVVHQFQLGVTAKVGADTTLAARLNTDNYVNALGGSTGQIAGRNANPGSDTYLDQLEITAPFNSLGKGGGLTLGRFLYNISPLTLWKPDVDTYFDNPMVDDGMYRMDGAKISTGLGSVGLQVFAAQTRSVQGINLGAWNSPLAGQTTAAVFAGGLKPAAQPTGGNAMTMDQLGGVNLTLPVRVAEGGSIRATAYHSTGSGVGGSYTSGRGVGDPYTNASVLGAGLDLKFTERVNVNGEWSKSITGTGRNIGNVNHRDNNAFTGVVGYNGGALSLSAGYKYIDPLFYAPGYWGRIGNWLNPTNIQGPTVRAGYDFSPSFGLNVGGDFYTGARNRGPDGLTSDDDITRVLVGLRWDVTKSFKTTVDWEGVYWKLAGVPSGEGRLAGTVHPTEQYLTFGTGYNVNDTTVLKLGYQLGSYNGRGPANGLGGIGSSYNFNVFTSQIAVKF